MKTTLQEMRRKAGFKSARAFAESIPMNPVTYTQYEQGIRNFTLEKAWEFADLLGCSLDELAGRQWPPEGASASADPGARPARQLRPAQRRRTHDCLETVASMARRADAGEGGGPLPGGLEAPEAV